MAPVTEIQGHGQVINYGKLFSIDVSCRLSDLVKAANRFDASQYYTKSLSDAKYVPWYKGNSGWIEKFAGLGIQIRDFTKPTLGGMDFSIDNDYMGNIQWNIPNTDYTINLKSDSDGNLQFTHSSLFNGESQPFGPSISADSLYLIDGVPHKHSFWDLPEVPYFSAVGYLKNNNGALTWEAASVSSLAWSQVTGKPTTIAGYGITDVLAQTLTGYAVGSNIALANTDSIILAFGKIQAQLNNKQASGSYLTSLNLSADFSGNGVSTPLTLANVVTANTYTKITFNAKGLVTSGSALLASDIPSLSISKIQGGAAARIPFAGSTPFGLVDSDYLTFYTASPTLRVSNATANISIIPTGLSVSNGSVSSISFDGTTWQIGSLFADSTGTNMSAGMYKISGAQHPHVSADITDLLTASLNMSNKTLTGGIIAGATLSGTIAGTPTWSSAQSFPTLTKIGTSILAQGSAYTYTLPTLSGADTLVSLTSTATLTNKTLTSPTINAIVMSAAGAEPACGIFRDANGQIWAKNSAGLKFCLTA